MKTLPYVSYVVTCLAVFVVLRKFRSLWIYLMLDRIQVLLTVMTSELIKLECPASLCGFRTLSEAIIVLHHF